MKKILLFGVLLGWYALVPPLGGSNAPLAAWEHFRSFDTARECEELMLSYVRGLETTGDAAPRAWKAQVSRVRCIESSDPRLGGK